MLTDSRDARLGTAYAERLGTRVELIPDSFTYLAEDQPELVATEGLARWQQ